MKNLKQQLCESDFNDLSKKATDILRYFGEKVVLEQLDSPETLTLNSKFRPARTALGLPAMKGLQISVDIPLSLPFPRQ